MMTFTSHFNLKFSLTIFWLNDFFRYPFDWQTLIGYITLLSIQIPTIYAAATILGILFISTIGFYWFITKMASEIEDKLCAMNKYSFNIQEKMRMSDVYGRNYLKRILVEVAQFHSDVLQLSHSFFLNHETKYYCSFFV